MPCVGFTVLLILAAPLRFSNGEVFTAISDMEVLLQTEKALTTDLQAFIKIEEERIKELKAYLKEYERVYEEASADTAQYLANPINAYVLVKRLTTDLTTFESSVMETTYKNFFMNMTQLRNKFKFPTTEDLNGAAVALTRLQDTYKLDTRELADGVLLGKKYSRNLTAGDCFELGRQLYNNKDFVHAEPWFRQALKKDLEKKRSDVPRLKILEYLEFTTFKLGEFREAANLADQILEIAPHHERIKVNKENYERYIKEEPIKRNDSSENPKPGKPTPVNQDDEHYKALCRGEQLLDPAITSQLKCRYIHKNITFLRLQPVKEEEALLNPRIVVYHDVLFDSEIRTIKRLAQPRLRRAMVKAVRTGKSYPAPFRIAKSCFINDFEHLHIRKIARRIGMVTGLDMSVAENLQVVNYGIGGQYEPHIDHSSDDAPNAYSPNDLDWGNRIATWLYYMTDVEAGGATVFPRLNVALWPRKGSAALWYNLLPNGTGDDRTFHASCPVLTGSKWVCNKWIHERTQLFRRPCKLSQDAQH